MKYSTYSDISKKQCSVGFKVFYKRAKTDSEFTNSLYIWFYIYFITLFFHRDDVCQTNLKGGLKGWAKAGYPIKTGIGLTTLNKK